MSKFVRSHRYPIVLAALCALVFIPFLGRVHLFDWDEINFAEISREMIVLGDYLRIHVNFEPFWEKPPFFFWLQVMAMKSFGIGEFAARLPNALCGIITILALYGAGQRLVNARFGLLWAGAYIGSILPHFYFKTGIIDPWFNLFIATGIYFFILFFWKQQERADVRLPGRTLLFLIISGLAIGMAILTKGPVAYLVFGLVLVTYWALDRFRLPVSVPRFVLLTGIALCITLAWYGLETLKHGPWFVKEFTRYQYILLSTPSAGHAGFPGYHFVVNWFGCFPASILALPALFGKRIDAPHLADFRKWMIILFWVVIILFSIVESKIVHYSSLVYFPLTFLAALTIHSIDRNTWSWTHGLTWAFLLTGGLLCIVIMAVPILGMHADWLASQISDPFAAANLQAQVRWSWWELIPGIILIPVLVMAARLVRAGRPIRGFIWICCAVAVSVWGVSYQFIPKIERYTQGAAIDFLKTLQGEDCYVDVLGYKSYAQYFYTRKPPPDEQRHDSEQWLLTGDIDKPAYFVSRINKVDRYLVHPGLEVLYKKNGYVFLKRGVD
ncbi:MAG: glycosyltransferase family 39 protein [Saprospiraceae bacterium]|nr:glycosyltransferase family 39 protein [Saprospiraceae bacterium]